MKTELTSLRIRLAGMQILGLFIALAAAAYLSGRQVNRGSELIATDAVPGTIAAHDMRMAMSRSVGYMMVAASAQTTQSRDASIKIAHDADVAFTNSLTEYKATIKINPTQDRALLDQVTNRFAEFQRQRMTYEALILAGNRDGSAAFLESNLVPVYVSATQSAEELLKYNHANSTTYANYIRSSVHRLYWAVAVVMVLALICAGVLVVNFATRLREIMRLRESEEKFSKAFQANPVGIAITEMETGEYLEVNESFCRLMGYSPQELIGRTPVELGAWSSSEERNQVFQPLRAGQTLRDFETQVRVREDGDRTVLVNAERIELGGKQCAVCLVEDVTERKRAVEQLEMLKVSIDNHFDAAYWLDTNNQLVYVNDSACRALGYTREELLGQPLTLIATHAMPQTLEEVWKRLRETGFLTRESVHRRKDGTEFPIEIVASYVRFEGKEFNCGFARDITERIEAEEALKNSHAQLRALSARLQSVREEESTRIAREIHDDLGQKLTGLKMDLLRAERKIEGLESLPGVNSLLDTIVGATELADSITTSIQEIATNLRPEMLDQLGLNAALCFECRRFQERTGVLCEARLPEAEPHLATEVSTALFRIFQECLTNVARHAHATRVEAALTHEDGGVALRVEDNGQGITKAEIANPSSLGLLGMKERVTLLGGEIVFQCGTEGGTIVTVRIPQSATLDQGKELV